MKGGEGLSGRVNGITDTMKNLMPQAGGGRKRKGSKRKGSSKRRGSRRGRGRSCRKGGGGIIATAAVPFGLLALQRYFKGSKTSKRGVRKMGRSFKRTFRRRH